MSSLPFPLLQSTVPGALGQLYTYMQTVAASIGQFNRPAGTIGVYLGLPIERVEPNYLMVGNDETGELFQGYEQDWVGMPATKPRKGEVYSIPCSVRTWCGSPGVTGGSAQVDRMNEAFQLVNGLLEEIMADPNGSSNGQSNLTASGSWQIKTLTNPASGPLGDEGGWGVVLELNVAVINVRING